MNDDQKSITDVDETTALGNDEQLGKDSPAAIKQEEVKEETDKLSDYRREADEIIKKYSTRPKVDKNEWTSTDAMREELSKYDSREIFAECRSIEDRTKSRKVEELYNLINYGTDAGLSRAEKELQNSNPSSHLSDTAETDDEREKYKQEKFQGFEDTFTVPIEGLDKPVANFDEEYDKLSDKIANDEISFEDETDTAQLPLIDDNPGIKPSADTDKKDELFKMVFGEDKTDDDPEPKKEKKKKKTNRENIKEKDDKQSPVYEYIDPAQKGEIFELLSKAIRKSAIRCFITILLTFGVLYLELASYGSSLYPKYLTPGRYGMLYTLADLQLLCFIAITLLDSIKDGCKCLFTGKPNGNSVFFMMFVVSVIYSLVTLYFDPSVTYGLICLPAAICGACCAVIKYLECRKDYHCFRIISTNRKKYVAQKLSGKTDEAMEFYSYLFENSDIYTTRKTKFVEGFFRRLGTQPESESLSGFVIMLSTIVAAVLFGYEIYIGSSVYESIASALKLLCFSLPVSSLFIITLPVIIANHIGKKNGSAFIGNAVGEEYADASVISFADTEVYPSRSVNVNFFDTYGFARIDEILYEMAKIFGFVGGPLKVVFDNMISGGVEKPESVRIIEAAENGLYVMMDGHEYLIGGKDYLRSYQMDSPYDNSDMVFERKSGAVMFVCRDGETLIKMHITYTPSRQFKELMNDMARAGLCVGIKTLDPNINTALANKTLKEEKNKVPCSILKSGSVHDVETESDRVDSGIVVNASLHTFLKMFVVCDKIRHITKSNGIINLVSVTVAFFVSFFLAMTGQLLNIASWYTALFQLIWIFPIGLISFFI